MPTEPTDLKFAVLMEPELSAAGLIVSGKSFRGLIRVGDVFCVARESDTSESFAAADKVTLAIESIELYGHIVEEVDEGLACRLRLTGEHHGRVRNGSMLVGESAGE